jgi:serine/threonine protein kinase
VRCFVQSYGWFEDHDSLYIAMEYLELGDLSRHVLLEGPLSEQDTRSITSQILEGIQFMHDNDFAHRDMKPQVRSMMESLWQC